ncbi:MAG: hypothetical protein ABIW31_00125 [Novosphingobium sp.]
MASNPDQSDPARRRSGSGATPLPSGGPPGPRSTGPGFPPVEHQFKPKTSGNPHGRPKKREMKMDTPSLVTGAQRTILDFASTVISDFDGKSTTNLQAVLRTLKAHLLHKPELVLPFVKVMMEASAQEEACNSFVVADAIRHKEEWGPKFRKARRLGLPTPDVYPDPDHIVIAGGTVHFLGPVTREDAIRLNAFLEHREGFITLAREVMERAGRDIPVEKAREIWFGLRGRYYKLNKITEKRYIKRFPSFRIPDDDDVGDESN